MAPAIDTSRPAHRSSSFAGRLGLPGVLACAGLLAGLAVAACGWALGGTGLPAAPPMQEARIDVSLGLRELPRPTSTERLLQPEKFARLSIRPTVKEQMAELTPEDIRSSHGRLKEVRLAAEAARRPAVPVVGRERVEITALPPVDPITTASLPSVMVTAYADSRAASSAASASQPFDLILPERQANLVHPLPENLPLPAWRPKLTVKPVIAEEEERQAPRRQLAYARPEPNAAEEESRTSRFTVPMARGKTAIYDITAGVVYMPNGERLEAHSGIGNMRDNPKYTHVKMRGPTPPGSYRLSMREALFHGVAAIRLTPTDGIAPLGRTGLLAHSYLLGPNGNSHGCVAFKDYKRFLNAFRRGDVTHMQIVPRISATQRFFARL
ncbi:DUF2778 domain-containing protein [Ensifer soli]|uniref:DUF2778 domain-containing protein n=1 Tax=Ciceribacter sp. sgz301302 TaxID=3342379 RepID=UPI0035B73241